MWQRCSNWALAAGLALLVAVSLHYTRMTHRWDDLLVEKFSAGSRHEVPSNLVIIGVDSTSIAELDRWPWPRRNHARLLDVLHDAAARRVFLDIDFSSPSNDEDDRLLAESVARWAPGQIILPVFLESTPGADADLSFTRPLPPLARNATLASVNFLQDDDSIVRMAEPAWGVGDDRFPSVFSVLSEKPAGHSAMPIDYSIAPASFAYYSYADVVRGRVPLEQLRGRIVLVGATAVELGDIKSVPIDRSLPGVMVHALATQTALIGAVRSLPTAVSLALLVAWTVALSSLMAGRVWGVNLLVSVLSLVFLAAAGYVCLIARFRLDVLPFAYATATSFIALTVSSLEASDLKARLLARLAKQQGVLLDSVLETSHDGILCLDHAGRIVSANAAALALFGGSATDLISRPIQELLPDAVTGGDGESLGLVTGRILESALQTPAGPLPVEVSATRTVEDADRRYTVVLRDLRERRRQEEALHYQATHDSVTALPNRAHLLKELSQRIDRQGAAPFSVLALKLARLQQVNDTLGLDVGDRVLVMAARRLLQATEGRGLIARLDGDSFVVVTDCDGRTESLHAMVQNLLAALRAPLDIDTIPIGVGLHIGVARFPQDATDAITLVRNASVALDTARQLGEELAFYDPEKDTFSVRHLALLGDLRAAIESDGLELHYQPKVKLSSGRAESVEALLRWNHPVRGFISPGELIPLIEPTEMLRPLTDWTIRRALAQQQDWAEQGVHVCIAVNLSARLLQDTSLPDRLAMLLATANALPEVLELEITESAMLLDAQLALVTAQRIRDLGIRLSVDDYGTGHSSLAYLRNLSVSALKLDRSFVDGLEHNDGNRAIVDSTLTLAHSLQLEVIAEGIETEWEAKYLREIGYDYGQGYYFARPLEPNECLRWILERNNRGTQPAAEARAVA